MLKQVAPLARKLLYKVAGSNDYNQAQGVMKDTIIRVLEEDLTPLLSQITATTHLFWGEDDGATPITDAQKMHHLIPGATLTTYPGERHNLPKRIPSKLSEDILKALR